MTGLQTLLAIWGSVLMLSGALYGAIIKLGSGKQKAICKEWMDNTTKNLETIKKDSGAYMTKEACLQKTLQRDKIIDERFKNTEKINQLEYENLTIRIQAIENMQAEKLGNLSKKIEEQNQTQKQMQKALENNNQLLLEAIKEIKENGNKK